MSGGACLVLNILVGPGLQGKLPEVEALKVARKINHHKQIWSATWKLVARGCGQGVLELRCLVRTLLYRLRINGPSVSLDDLSIFADYVRFLLVPSQASREVGANGYVERKTMLLYMFPCIGRHIFTE